MINDVDIYLTSSSAETKKGTKMTVVRNEGQLMYLGSFQKWLRSVKLSVLKGPVTHRRRTADARRRIVKSPVRRRALLCDRFFARNVKFTTNAQRAKSAWPARRACIGHLHSECRAHKGRTRNGCTAACYRTERMDRACTAHSTHSQRTALGSGGAAARLACCHIRVGHQGEQMISRCLPKQRRAKR